jgi:hypothetical protein
VIVFFFLPPRPTQPIVYRCIFLVQRLHLPRTTLFGYLFHRFLGPQSSKLASTIKWASCLHGLGRDSSQKSVSYIVAFKAWIQVSNPLSYCKAHALSPTDASSNRSILTPYHPLYTSNERPHPQEEAFIRMNIVKNQAELDALQAKLGTLDKEGIKRRRSLLDILLLQRSAVSPVRCVPHEILSEIFAHAIGVYDSSIFRVTDSTNIKTGPIWVLGRVCRRWRAIVKSSPKLWSYIALCNHNKSTWALEVALERSHDLPLTLSVLRMPGKRKYHRKAMKVLLEHFNRWHNVTLALPFDKKMMQMFFDEEATGGKEGGRPFPRYGKYLDSADFDDARHPDLLPNVLHSLILHHYTNGSSPASKFPLDLINYFSSRARFQNIRRLVLRCDLSLIPIQSPHIDACIPWKQLEFFDNATSATSRDRNQPSAENTLSMLKRMPKLTVLNIHDDPHSTLDQTQSISPKVTLHHVHTAAFKSYGVLPALHLPALEHIVLGYLGSGSSNKTFISEFSGLLTRSSPPLKSITFKSLGGIEDTFDLLRCLPSSVETLAYIHYKHPDSLLRLLDLSQSSDATPSMLLPNLKEFTIYSTGGFAPDPDTLLSCVKSRLRYDSDNVISSLGLRRLKVMYDNEAKIPIGDYERILALMEEGLSVSICAVKDRSLYPDLLLSHERYPW